MARSFAKLAMTGVAGLALSVGCSHSKPVPPTPAPFAYALNMNIDLNAYRASLPSREKGHTRARLGAGCTNCWTDVTITAYKNAKWYGAEHYPRTPGDKWPIAHIVNNGPLTTAMYSLRPISDNVEYDVYIVLDGGVPGWEIIESPTVGSGPLKVQAKGKFVGCNHEKKATSEADFRNCDYDVAQQKELRLASKDGWEQLISRLLPKKSNAVMLTEDPAWISCTEGCCTLTMAQQQ